MKFKAAIFDIDGTVLDSMPVWRNIATRYLTGRGIKPDADLEVKISEMHLAEGSEYIRQQYHLPESSDEISESVLSLGRHSYEAEVALKPGVREFLEKLSAAGIPMCLATSGSSELAGKALERLGVLHLFQALLSCDETGCGKNDGAIYFRAAELMGTAPAETAVFEDSLYALAAAKRAGFYTVGVEDPDSLKDREEIKKAADRFIGSFSDPKDLSV